MKLDFSETRDGFRFRGGTAVLDLTATLAARLKSTPKELLRAPSDLTRWFAAAGVTTASVAASDSDLELARSLRESIYQAAVFRIAGKAIPDQARRLVNRVAALVPAVVRLERDDELRITGDARAILANIAREAVGLFARDSPYRVRQCEGETCTLLFVDTSRKGERRWCSMAGCGNKAKVKAFRNRARHLP